MEDDAQIAEWVTLLLSREGFRVQWVEDAEQAVAALNCGLLPDFALLDVMLPKMDGFELLAQIRANPDYGSLLVVMVTGRVSDGDVMRGLRSGADGYIFKPFKPHMLIESVRNVLCMHSKQLASEDKCPSVA